MISPRIDLRVELHPRSELLTDVMESLKDAFGEFAKHHKAAEAYLDAKVQGVGSYAATVRLQGSTAPTSRPSPSTDRCHCRPHTDGSGRPRAHVRACPDYTIEDEAWVRTHYVGTGQAPTYAEALAAVRQAAELRHRYAVPSKYITITLPARTTDELFRDLGESLRDALHAQSELKARHLTGQRCGACSACLGLTASTLCERELVAPREAVRRLWCHVQAICPDGLSTEARAVLGALRRAIEVLAQSAGVK